MKLSKLIDDLRTCQRFAKLLGKDANVYYVTEGEMMMTHASVEQRVGTGDVFLYIMPTASHQPLHAPETKL